MTEYFESNNIVLLDDPPQSPDLNPIENLWSQLNRKIKLSERNSLNNFKHTVLEAWSALDLDDIRKLIDSMPKRLQKVIDKKGYATAYSSQF